MIGLERYTVGGRRYRSSAQSPIPADGPQAAGRDSMVDSLVWGALAAEFLRKIQLHAATFPVWQFDQRLGMRTVRLKTIDYKKPQIPWVANGSTVVGIQG